MQPRDFPEAKTSGQALASKAMATEATTPPTPDAPGYVELTVRLRVAAPDLAGHLLAPDQPPQAFTSWLELLATLDAAVDRIQLPTELTPPAGQD